MKFINTNIKMEKLNNQQRQVLLSGILGDGCLRNSRAVFSCIHKEYMQLKKKMLGDIALEVERKENSGFKKDAFIYKLLTLPHPEIKEMQNYSTKRVIEELDEIGIALWIADDGSRHKKNNFYNINTHAIPRQEEEDIILPFFENRGIFPRITTETKKDGRCFSYLYIPKWEGAMEISRMFRVLNLECYSYKLMPIEMEDAYFKSKDLEEFKMANSYGRTKIIKKGMGLNHRDTLHKNVTSINMVNTNSANI